MKTPNIVQNSYPLENRPEYEQITTENINEPLQNLKELYLDDRCGLHPLKYATTRIPKTELNFFGFNQSVDKDYTSNDWHKEIKRKTAEWRKNVPFFDYKEISVLLPDKNKDAGLEELKDSTTPCFERSIAVYATENLEDEKIEEFLWELGKALESEL